MGAFSSRQNAAIEEADQSSNYAYKYPPRCGNFFGSHFIMGGERFDTPQPESYLFGENADLNFLGNRPTAFPYPPPQASEPTKTLKSLVNIRKESVRFVRTIADKKKSIESTELNGLTEQVDGNVLCIGAGGGDGENIVVPCSYNIEFTFDADCKCAITIYYFCTEEVSPSGVTLVPHDGLTSETYHYEKGMNQYFSQPGHVFNPQLIPEDDLVYNSTKEQYPVAIHCVVEEGNEDCRQSHTTICVIDHHPDSNSYVLRALKQKIFCDGLCYLLQEIYGIENKAVNKSSIDEDIDDHGSECVICMSETRDTLILPCRHLCLCNSCADSLRYQANNCPICRAPFRALLQVRAVQKGVLPHILHQNPPATGPGEPVPTDLHLPPGYIPISLIEALNGPPQYVGRPRNIDTDVTDAVVTISTEGTLKESLKAGSPLKPNVQKRQKSKKHVSTSTNTTEVSATAANNNTNSNAGDNDHDNTIPHPLAKKGDKLAIRASQDKLQIVNERNSLKLPTTKRRSSGNITNNAATDEDEDSENEKLSPLLSPGSKYTSATKELIKNVSNDSMNNEVVDIVAPGDYIDKPRRGSQRKQPPPQNKTPTESLKSANITTELDTCASEDPLCIEHSKINDKLSSLRTNVNINNAHSLVNKNLHKKSTSVGNIVGNNGNNANELKANVSSLPDMLDTPISGNSGSTRSSSDSYSSSSSTKQLLSSNTVTVASNAANIIVDDKTALQNAVNV